MVSFDALPRRRSTSALGVLLHHNCLEFVLLAPNAQKISQSITLSDAGDLPVIGRVFRRRITRQDQQELLVFVTPTLVSQPTVVPVVDAPLNSALPEAEVGEPPL